LYKLIIGQIRINFLHYFILKLGLRWYCLGSASTHYNF
jgi:hypothetical protein